MSRILIITNHSYMLWRFRRELIKELMRTHEVILSMPFTGHETDFKALGLRCIETAIDRRGINPLTDFRLLRTYRRLLKKEQPDLVITYSIKPNIYAGLLCGRMKIPFCVNVQGLGTAFQKAGLAEFVTLLYRMALRKAETVFFENRNNAAEFCKRKIIRREKAIVLSGAGINLEEYSYMAYPANETVHFLFLGRIMKEKGIDELFAAMRKLHNKYGSKAVLDLVGFFEDGYKEQVEQLQTEGIVIFHGFQDEPRPWYTLADCVVLPSWHEGMSNVLLEAAATGRPVITSDIPGCREAVEDGVTGFLIRVHDSESLYEAMELSVEMSSEERSKMGQAGRRKMEKEFERMHVVQNTIRVLQLNK